MSSELEEVCVIWLEIYENANFRATAGPVPHSWEHPDTANWYKICFQKTYDH